MTLTAVSRRLHLCLSPWKRLSSPIEASKRLRGAMRCGLLSLSPVFGAGILIRLEVNCDARQAAGKRCEWSGPDAVAGEAGLELLIGGQGRSKALTIGCRLAVERGRGAERRELLGSDDVVAGRGPGNQAAVIAPVEAAPQAADALATGSVYCRCVVWLNFSSWSMRKG